MLSPPTTKVTGVRQHKGAYELEDIYYPDLVRLYPDLSIEEEEGVTELEKIIEKDGVILTYESGEKELCIYKDIGFEKLI